VKVHEKAAASTKSIENLQCTGTSRLANSHMMVMLPQWTSEAREFAVKLHDDNLLLKGNGRRSR
jgi:hypothetical protein